MNTAPFFKLYAHNTGPYFFFYQPFQFGFWTIFLDEERVSFLHMEDQDFLSIIDVLAYPSGYDWDEIIYKNYTNEFNAPIKVKSEIWTLEERGQINVVNVKGPRGGNRGFWELEKTETLARLLIIEGESAEVLQNITRHNKWPQIEEKANPERLKY